LVAGRWHPKASWNTTAQKHTYFVLAELSKPYKPLGLAQGVVVVPKYSHRMSNYAGLPSHWRDKSFQFQSNSWRLSSV
jgi:hypothetical protein